MCSCYIMDSSERKCMDEMKGDGQKMEGNVMNGMREGKKNRMKCGM